MLSISPDLCDLQTNGDAVEYVKRFTYIGFVFSGEGKWEDEISLRIGMASGVVRKQDGAVFVAKAEPSVKTKLSVVKSIFLQRLPMIVSRAM
ncbi:unnamed protein product [Soboliphyme baturini]|uniref:Profilin n=1 Tax=Soboliphyme baturini TaxID=241478 RepID=A0A183IPM3_9BILA|nr:unnamed protein product [Soboliphyme baturini]